MVPGSPSQATAWASGAVVRPSEDGDRFMMLTLLAGNKGKEGESSGPRPSRKTLATVAPDHLPRHEGALYVLAVAHDRRPPAYWSDRAVLMCLKAPIWWSLVWARRSSVRALGAPSAMRGKEVIDG